MLAVTGHVFVDESKRGGYLVTAAVLPSNLGRARQAVRGLILPGQRRLHFTHESDNRRKQILDVIAELRPTVTIYDGSAHDRRRQREACQTLEYRHHRAHEEPLLAIPDALPWCWQRGGPWKARAKDFVADVK